MTDTVGDDRLEADSMKPAEDRPWRLAGLLVLPFFLLSLSWAFSNPPFASPDETLHLVKALGNGSFQFGEPGPPVPDTPTLENRNNSTIRIYEIPSKLAPNRKSACFAYAPLVTPEDCQPRRPPTDVGLIKRKSEVGAYPPFAYVPLGRAALLGETPAQAIIAGRLAAALISAGLLLLGTAHMIRWLGRSATLGIAAAMTPVAVFITGSLTPSGIEITSAAAVAAVVTVAALRPASIHASSTHWTLMVVGTVLATTRQLGALVLGGLLILMLIVIGWSHIKRLLTGRQLSFFVSSTVLIAVAIMITWYELTFDHPAGAGSVLTPAAIEPFLNQAYTLMSSGIGLFGWLDTPAPRPLIGGWTALWVVLVGGTLLLGRRREAWILIGALTAVWVLAFCVYASGYYPLGVFGQGRHLLPAMTFIVIFSGATLARRLQQVSERATRRLFLAAAIFIGAAQAFSIYWNARRYAVGMAGDVWFLGSSEWSPRLGWVPWLLLAVGAGALLATVIYRFRPVVTPVVGAHVGAEPR